MDRARYRGLTTIVVVRDCYLYTIIIYLPFCLIWGYCTWLHRGWQLKRVNILSILLYHFGPAEYYFFPKFWALPID